MESETGKLLLEKEGFIMEAKEIIFCNEKVKIKYNNLFLGDYTQRELAENIENALSNIKKNAFSGIQIAKRLIPKEYVKKYNISNLWKYNLPNGWRLIYSIQSYEEITVLAIIIEYLDHKDYEKRFKYVI